MFGFTRKGLSLPFCVSEMPTGQFSEACAVPMEPLSYSYTEVIHAPFATLLQPYSVVNLRERERASLVAGVFILMGLFVHTVKGWGPHFLAQRSRPRQKMHSHSPHTIRLIRLQEHPVSRVVHRLHHPLLSFLAQHLRKLAARG